MDADLNTFLQVTGGAYKSMSIQVILNWMLATTTPLPDHHVYVTKADFDPKANETFDPAPSDSENNLYLITNGKWKARAWARSDHGLETKKAKIW